MKAFVIGLAALFLLGGCATRLQKSTIVLEYDDFGPQAMAYKLIGKKRMPWAPDTPVMIGEGHIYVVVYKGVPVEDLEIRYSADADANIDYRLVPYEQAITYLDTQIAQNILRKVTLKLEGTRTKVQSKLGSK